MNQKSSSKKTRSALRRGRVVCWGQIIFGLVIYFTAKKTMPDSEFQLYESIGMSIALASFLPGMYLERALRCLSKRENDQVNREKGLLGS